MPDEKTSELSSGHRRDWENTYREKGIVQNEPLFTVRALVPELEAAPPKRLLDLGCGTGRHTLLFAKIAEEVYGFDSSESALLILESRCAAAAVENVFLHQGDMCHLPFPDNYFDIVICVWTVGHGDREQLFSSVREMLRVTAPSGLLYTDIPSRSDPNFGRGSEISPNTFLHPFLDHSDVPHYYASPEDMTEMASLFTEAEYDAIEYWDSKYSQEIAAYWLRARK